MASFESILTSILSEDRATRQYGDYTLTDLLHNSLESTTLSLIDSLSSTDDKLSGLAAVLIRRKIIEEGAISRLSSSTIHYLKNSIISLISSSRSSYILRRLGDVLINLSEHQGWHNDMAGYMYSWASNSDPSVKELAFYLFELTTNFEKFFNLMYANMSHIMGLFHAALQDPNLNLRIACLHTVCSFLASFAEESLVMKYDSFVDYILCIVKEAVQTQSDVSKLTSLLNTAAELTDNFPRIWRAKINEITGLCASIARDRNFDSTLRAAALEIILALVRKVPGLLKSNNYFIEETVSLSFLLINELDNISDLSAWNNEPEETEIIHNDPYSLGKDLLNKLSNYLEESIIPSLVKLIPMHLENEDWTRVHTGILAIGIAAEGCHDWFSNNLQHALNMLVPYCSSSNPRLIWAAVTSLGLLCTEFEPEIQTHYHAQVLVGLMGCMKIEYPTRLLTQVSSCMINYAKGLLSTEENEIKACFNPYVPLLMQNFYTILQEGMRSGCNALLQETLNALSVLSTVLQSDFSDYYNYFMPSLLSIVQANVTTIPQKEVRACSIRCIGHIVESVSELSSAVETALQIMNQLMELKRVLEDDDPALNTIYESISYFAMCLKDQFLPFLDIWVKELWEKASMEVEMALYDADSEEAKSLPVGMNAVRFELKGLGTKQLAVSTVVLENKIKACKILYEIVDSLENGFEPYAMNTLNVLLPLINYKYNKDIRKYSVKTISLLFKIVSIPQREIMLARVAPDYASTFKASISTPEDLKRQIKSLLSCFEFLPNISVIGLSTCVTIASTLSECLRSVFTRKVERMPNLDSYSKSEEYESELAELQYEEDIDDEIIRSTMEIIGKFLQTFKTQFQGIFLEHFKNIYAELFYKQNSNDIEILSAICVFDDYIEHTHDLMLNEGKSPLLEHLIKYSYSSNPDIRQSAIYGVGLCAQMMNGQVMSQYLEHCLNAVMSIISRQDAFTEDLASSTECAIGAYGKLALYHLPEYIPNWLTNLPVKSDPEEAKSVHKLFLSHIGYLKPHKDLAMQVVYNLSEMVRTQPEILDEADRGVLISAPGILSN